MRRPQFSLKMLLWLPLAVATFLGGLRIGSVWRNALAKRQEAAQLERQAEQWRQENRQRRAQSRQ
jgi:hypothetical protein